MCRGCKCAISVQTGLAGQRNGTTSGRRDNICRRLSAWILRSRQARGSVNCSCAFRFGWRAAERGIPFGGHMEAFFIAYLVVACALVSRSDIKQLLIPDYASLGLAIG